MDKYRSKIKRKQFLKIPFDIDSNGLKFSIIIFAIAFIALILGFVITNYIIMPNIIGYGKEITIPDITGMSIETARQFLRNSDIDIRIVNSVYSGNIEKDIIISQNPLPNTKVKFNRIVEVVISKGVEKTIIPVIRMLYIKEAIKTLTENGFTIKDTVYTFSQDVPENSAINTFPPAGVIANKGSEITLYISRGKKDDYVLMPSFFSLSKEEAEKLAISKGLIIGDIIEKPGDYDRPTVIMQSPDSNLYVPKGDTIILTIGIPIYE